MAAKGKKTAKVVEPAKGAAPKGKLFCAPLGPDVPKIITLSLNHLRDNAITEEGLFRISGPIDEVQQLKERWDSGKDIDLKKYSPHTVAGTMKLYLRELPEPLLSYQFYSAFITTDAITNNDSRVASVRKLLSLLPRTNCDIMRLLMGFFHEMLQHKAKTKMTSSNLAIIIAPNILRCKTESVQQIMRDAPHVQSVIRCMIDDFPALFDRPIEPAQRRRTVHDFTAGDARPEPSLSGSPPAAGLPEKPPAQSNARPSSPPPKEPTSNKNLKLAITPPEPSVAALGLLSPRIQEISVEIASTVPAELRAVFQHVADRFIELRTVLQKATHSVALAAVMHLLVACAHVAEGQALPEGQVLPTVVSSPPATDSQEKEAILLKDMLKHFFVTVHKKVASLARTAAKADSCPAAHELKKITDVFFAPAPAGQAPPEITFVALRTVIIRYLDDLAHRLCFLQIEVAAPGKNYAPLLATLTNHMASLKGGPVESVEGRTALDVLRSLQASLAERHRELLEDTILLPDETGLKRLITVSNVAVAMRRELVRVLDQPMPEAALQVPTPKNESNLYSVRSDAIKLLHRIQHNLLPALRKELLHTPSEQRSMAIGQIVRSVKAALDQPEKRDFLKEKVISEPGDAVAEEDRARLQTLQEVIGFVFVAVEGALTNLRSDLDSSAYEATATSQLLTEIDHFLTLNLDASGNIASPKPSAAAPAALASPKAVATPPPIAREESDQQAFVRRTALTQLEQLQEDVNSLRGELESTQAVMLALAISKLGSVLKKLMNGETVDESQFVARPQLDDSSDSKERDKLEALKKLTFLTFDKAQAYIFKQCSAVQNAKTEAEINDIAAATSQLRRAFEAFK